MENRNKNYNKLNVAHINIRSLVPKCMIMKNYVINNKIDILAISESWLTHAILDEVVCMEGFQLVRRDRACGRGGGVVLYVRDSIRFTEIMDCKTEYSEQIWIEFNLRNIKTILGLIYRPPGGDSVHDFLNEFEENTCKNLLNCDNYLCTGDFNINVMNLHCPYVQRFNLILSAYNVTQIIAEPTRQGLNNATLIDLIVCSNVDMIGDSCVDHEFDVSDHFLIKCKLNLESIKPRPFFKTCRDYRNFDRMAFNGDLQNVPFDNIYYLNDIDEKINLLNFYILELFDLHAPLRTFRITKKRAPWLTPNIKYLMSLRNRALSKYKRRKSAEDWESYRQLRNFVTTAVSAEKRAYLEHRVQNNDPKENWKLLKSLNIYSQARKIVPEHIGTADEINTFFVGASAVGHPDPVTLNFYLTNRKDNIIDFKFRLATEKEIERALLLVKSEAVGCDGIGLSMLIRCCPCILPVIIHIVNSCIENGQFPGCWKTSHVLPLPKVSCPSELKHLRPISILPTLSKVIERILEDQIREHVLSCQILPAFQSGYRKDYSCTTALLKVTDDILEASDRGELTALILLDYSKAFDRLNHDLLLAVLAYVGFDESAQVLIRSYLTGRRQAVKLNGALSSMIGVPCGVPQGSILGPLLFSIYTSQLVTFLRHSTAHFYADDTQIYLSFNPDNAEEAGYRLNEDLQALMKASRDHCLEINPAKSQFLLFGRGKSRERCRDLLKISINNEVVGLCNSAKNLGILMDTDLRFSEHINNCIRRAFANLKLVFAQRSHLNEKLKKLLCDSIVLSHFNYGDALYGPCLLNIDARRIQLMQNSCIRLICGLRGRERGVSAKIREIGWFRMDERRLLHSLVLFNKIIFNKRPDYLYDKIKFRYDAHNLDLRHKCIITPPSHRTTLYERSFSYQVSHLYNRIPANLMNVSGHRFKCYVKNSIQHGC